ncbi:MAG: hypothetical protein AAFY76_01015 [Cyanobacteria bacterium J06649_11]
MKELTLKQDTEAIWVSLSTMRKMFDMSEKTLRRMNKDGDIRLYRIRGRLFAKIDEVKKDIENLARPVTYEISEQAA